MSTTTTNEAPPTDKVELEAHAHGHPSDGDYVKIALLLGVTTAAAGAPYFSTELFGSEPSPFALVATLFPILITQLLPLIRPFLPLHSHHPPPTRPFTPPL